MQSQTLARRIYFAEALVIYSSWGFVIIDPSQDFFLSGAEGAGVIQLGRNVLHKLLLPVGQALTLVNNQLAPSLENVEWLPLLRHINILLICGCSLLPIHKPSGHP